MPDTCKYLCKFALTTANRRPTYGTTGLDTDTRTHGLPASRSRLSRGLSSSGNCFLLAVTELAINQVKY